MILGFANRRTRWFQVLTLVGGVGVLYASIVGCNPEFEKVLADGLEAGLLAGIPSLFDWITENLEQETTTTTVPTVLLESFRSLQAMLA